MRIYIPLITIVCLVFVSCETKHLVLVQNQTTDYELIIPEQADSLEWRAAQELQYYLEAISGVSIPVSADNNMTSRSQIFIGRSNQLDASQLRKHEILVKATNDDLIIAGGDPRSTLYAAYTFLERHLGCRFYAPDCEVIPESSMVTIPKELNERYLPPVTTRTVHSRLYYDNHNFADKRKVTYEAFPNYVPSARVHTFHRFVPAKDFLKEHPEYFALRNGRRIPTQLCLTNAEVLQLVKDTVAALLQKYPESDVISVSQDDNQQYCQCPSCAEVDEREGSPSGSMIEFVNSVAAEFPDKTISTLAYQYTRKAPGNIKPAKNVLITLCSIECDRSAPIDEKCLDFTRDLEAWSKLTDNIRIWDYTTQFTNFLAPFPNLHTLQPNIQLFVDNNAKWIFEQHSHQPSELFELRSYLTARLLWDPNINQDAVVADFLSGYYGEAAPFIQKYITTIHEELQKDEDFFLFLYGDPSQGFGSFLRPQLLRQYNEWFDQAEEAVKEDPVLVNRVRKARLSVDFAVLEASRKNDPTSFSMTEKLPDGKVIVSPTIQHRLDKFRKTCAENQITMMNEMRLSVDEYLDFYDHSLTRAVKANMATGKPVELLTNPKKYANEDPQTLTDGALGGSSFYANWLGFEGNNLEAIIDLQTEKNVREISMDLLQVVNHIVFFPTEVRYYASADGKTFRPLGKVATQKPLSADSKINDIQTFGLDFDPVSARFIKVIAVNMGTAPDWHHGAGLPCWIFADEVLVQ